jgi:hypothetical protein
MRHPLKISVVAMLLTCAVSGSVGSQQPRDDQPTIRPQEGPSCPWYPIDQSMPAAGQCGFNRYSIPNPGIFQCGLVSDGKACVEHCVFVRCQSV